MSTAARWAVAPILLFLVILLVFGLGVSDDCPCFA